ncbi:MAG: hypothetical protein ACYDG4_17040 [Desulfuromonadaceae bacterium]
MAVIINGSTGIDLPEPLPAVEGGTGSTGLTGIIVGNGAGVATTIAVPTGDLVGTTAAQTLSNKTMTMPVISGQKSPYVSLGTVSTGTATFNYSLGAHQSVQVGGAITLEITNMPTGGFQGLMILEIINGGSAALTMPAINWVKIDGTFTTSFSTYLSNVGRTALQASGTDFLVVWSRDGTNLYGKIL